jgi:DNA-directed RNA polymerase specialized sigma24 family protein
MITPERLGFVCWELEGFMLAQKLPNLTNFNRLILQFQEEAYTLAFYMLGNELQACETVQKAITYAYHHPPVNDIQLGILSNVTSLCMQLPARAIDLEVVPEIVRRLCNIPNQERLAVILVDILGLNYAQAAIICRKPEAQISRLLSHARVRMLAWQPV